MNSLNVTGRLGQDAKIKAGESGVETAKFSIFVKQYKKGDSNAGFWLNVVHFKPNQFLKDLLKQGQQVAISGRLDISSYNDKWYTNMLSNSIDVFSKGGGEPENNEAKVADTKEDTNDLPF